MTCGPVCVYVCGSVCELLVAGPLYCFRKLSKIEHWIQLRMGTSIVGRQFTLIVAKQRDEWENKNLKRNSATVKCLLICLFIGIVDYYDFRSPCILASGMSWTRWIVYLSIIIIIFFFSMFSHCLAICSIFPNCLPNERSPVRIECKTEKPKKKPTEIGSFVSKYKSVRKKWNVRKQQQEKHTTFCSSFISVKMRLTRNTQRAAVFGGGNSEITFWLIYIRIGWILQSGRRNPNRNNHAFVRRRLN